MVNKNQFATRMRTVSEYTSVITASPLVPCDRHLHFERRQQSDLKHGELRCYSKITFLSSTELMAGSHLEYVISYQNCDGTLSIGFNAWKDARTA
jgi:hypothetical protein